MHIIIIIIIIIIIGKQTLFRLEAANAFSQKFSQKYRQKRSLNFIVKVLSWATATPRNRNKNDWFTLIKHRAGAVGGESLVH